MGLQDLDLQQILEELKSWDEKNADLSNEQPLDPTIKTAYTIPEPTIEETTEKIKSQFLKPSSEVSWDLLDEFQDIPQVTQDDTHRFYDSLLTLPPTLGRTAIRFKRRGIAGSIDSYKEVFDISSIDNGESASVSLSMKRKFNSKSDSLTGNTTQMPFQPGGLAEKGKPSDSSSTNSAIKFLHKDPNGLYDIPQGLSRGLSLEYSTNSNIEDINSKFDELDINDLENMDTVDGKDDNEKDLAEALDDNTSLFSATTKATEISSDDGILDEEIGEILPSRMLIKPAKASDQPVRKREWAHMIELSHEIENFDELVPNMARKWPFKLDIFQQEAIYHLEQGDSVFVAAHTSAGKTVVAEYAIAMANRNMTKAIYTSPIKALSNQKFRDFKHTFQEVDVGVITGDVQINPEANCLIMTTEILRSMLYRGADLIRDVEFVIFDEVHYVNDADRGVVWEEVIIMLPDHIKVILLSATVPNTYEFASWVGRTKQKDIYVINTPKRPVPLEIFVWAKDETIKLVDANRNFLEKNFKKHVEKLDGPSKKDSSGGNSAVATRGGRGGRGGFSGSSNNNARGGFSARGGRGGGNSGRFMQRDGPNKNTWSQLVQYLRKNDLMPAVIFVFSKKRCEEYADTVSGVNFCTHKESSEIHMFIDKCVSRLKREDRELPQILRVREMLGRGIGVHHGGLLPIVKECIEILFSKSLIKVLFTTETFAMGLNLPTRTVVFSELRKHDGTGFRNLLPGEFTQMSGRAGRRGLDSTGTVITMAYNRPLEQAAFKEVTLGTPTKLSSQFRLTYNMILNLLRIEALNVEEMIRRSFSENSSQSLLPQHQQKLLLLNDQLKKTELDCTSAQLVQYERFFDLMETLKRLYGELVTEGFNNPVCRKKLQVGRLIIYRDEETKESYPGITVSPSKTHDNIVICKIALKPPKRQVEQYGVCYDTSFGDLYCKKFFKRWTSIDNQFQFIEIPLKTIEHVTHISISSSINGVIRKVPEAIDMFNDEMYKLMSARNYYKEYKWTMAQTLSMKSLNDEVADVREKISELLSDPEFINNDFHKNYPEILKKKKIEGEINSIKKMLSDENLELLPDYEQRLLVLEKLNFINVEQNTITLKGRVACEINSGWELAMTELVFDNFLGDFTSEEIVALLSCFVYEGKRSNNQGNGDEGDKPELMTPKLELGKTKIEEIIKRTLEVCSQNQVTLTSEEESFLENNRFGLVNTVFEWARGLSFKQIMTYEDGGQGGGGESEGTIVRVITRLDEICREVKNCALIIGDSELHLKISEAQEKIKRDIVFCASLYL